MRTTTGPGQMGQDSTTMAGCRDNPIMLTKDTLPSISRHLVGGMMYMVLLRKAFCANTQVQIFSCLLIIADKVK